MRILAVDDDPIILDLLSRSLELVGEHELTCCKSAEDAMQLVLTAQKPYECFLLDIMLPGQDGIALCDTLRAMAEYRSVPILMVTGGHAIGLMERAFQAGATDFLNKPFNGVELTARIRSAGILNASLLRSDPSVETAEAEDFESCRDLRVKGLSHFAELDNRLLRMPPGGFAMSLVGLEVENCRGFYRAVGSHAFHKCMAQVARAIAAVIQDTTTDVAYAGSGRFVCVIRARKRSDRNTLISHVNDTLVKSWDAAALTVPTPPRLIVQTISNQHILSGLSASNAMQSYFDKREAFADCTPDNEERLFGKLDQVMQRTA